MRIHQIIWDLDEDPDGNVQHIAEHGLSIEEDEVVVSYSSGRPIVLGETGSGKRIAVEFDVVEENLLALYR